MQPASRGNPIIGTPLDADGKSKKKQMKQETSIFKRVMSSSDEELKKMGNEWSKISNDENKNAEIKSITNFLDLIENNIDQRNYHNVNSELSKIKPTINLSNKENLKFIKHDLLKIRKNLVRALMELPPHEIDKLEKLTQSKGDFIVFSNIFDSVRAAREIKAKNSSNIQDKYFLGDLAKKMITAKDPKAVRQIEEDLSFLRIGDNALSPSNLKSSLLYSMFQIHREKGDFRNADLIAQEMAPEVKDHSLNELYNKSFNEILTAGNHQNTRDFIALVSEKGKRQEMYDKLFTKLVDEKNFSLAKEVAYDMPDEIKMQAALAKLPTSDKERL